MKADAILKVMNREIRTLAETYARNPAVFTPLDFKDKIEAITSWAERAEKDEGDSDFVDFTQWHLDKTRK